VGTAANPADALFSIVAQAGYTQETFNACLTNRDLEHGYSGWCRAWRGRVRRRLHADDLYQWCEIPWCPQPEEYAEIIDPLIG
jgi:hypothetical protein